MICWVIHVVYMVICYLFRFVIYNFVNMEDLPVPIDQLFQLANQMLEEFQPAPYWPLLQNFLQLQQPVDYIPPNPHFYDLLKSHSQICILMDFLDYLLSHPDFEGQVTERIVVSLLDGTEFYSENHNYFESIRGFTHLFCDPTCFRNCAFAHKAFRQNYFWDFMDSVPHVVDIFKEKRDSYFGPPRLQFLAWKKASLALASFWDSKVLPNRYHYPQFLQLREELSSLLPPNVEEVSLLLTPSYLNPDITQQSVETVQALGHSLFVHEHLPDPFKRATELWIYLCFLIIHHCLPRSSVTLTVLERLVHMYPMKSLEDYCCHVAPRSLKHKCSPHRS